MKRVLIIQNDASTSGGVWSVNKTLAHSLVNDGYVAEILAIRDKFKEEEIKNVRVCSLNPKKKWLVPTRNDINDSFKSKKYFKCLGQLFKNIDRRFDIFKARSYVKKYNPDYIIASHYQVLDAIPKKYLKKTFNVHHNSYDNLVSNKANYDTLKKYNGRVRLCWLSKNIMDKAILDGFDYCAYVYNPVKFETKEISNVVDNKKLIAITRITKEKRIDLMVDMVSEIFKSRKFRDWTLDIYGDGAMADEIIAKTKNMKRINVHDRVSDVKKYFLEASINLNTSLYEGFPMNILEASECGVPTISFDYGEASGEQIINNKTGVIVKQDDINAYKEELKKLMSDFKLLDEYSKNAKDYNETFSKKNNLEAWKKLFNELEG